MPFSYFKNDHIRHHYKLCALPEFPITGLNNKQVNIIVEIYNAPKNAVMKDLTSDIKTAPIPLASLNVEFKHGPLLLYIQLFLFIPQRSFAPLHTISTYTTKVLCSFTHNFYLYHKGPLLLYAQFLLIPQRSFAPLHTISTYTTKVLCSFMHNFYLYHTKVLCSFTHNIYLYNKGPLLL